MKSLKVIYFKMRALAEAPLMLMNYAGIDYEYLMAWDYFNDEWENCKSKVPFKELPVLVVDDKYQIAQSISIMHYIEKIASLELDDPVASAMGDAILQSAQELFRPLNPTVNFAVGEDFDSKCQSMKPSLISRFKDLERALVSNVEKFFIDDVPRACEFATYHHLDISRELDPELLGQFSRLKQFVQDIEEIESVANYLDSRPKLIDVKVGPKLVIDGVAHPTGIQKT